MVVVVIAVASAEARRAGVSRVRDGGGREGRDRRGIYVDALRLFGGDASNALNLILLNAFQQRTRDPPRVSRLWLPATCAPYKAFRAALDVLISERPRQHPPSSHHPHKPPSTTSQCLARLAESPSPARPLLKPLARLNPDRTRLVFNSPSVVFTVS